MSPPTPWEPPAWHIWLLAPLFYFWFALARVLGATLSDIVGPVLAALRPKMRARALPTRAVQRAYWRYLHCALGRDGGRAIYVAWRKEHTRIRTWEDAHVGER